MTSKPMLTPFLMSAALVSAAGLGGCSSSGNDPAPVENREEPVPLSTEAPAEVAPAAASPTPSSPANASEALPPEEAPAPDEQMMDDAAATGMTARASRDQPPANDGVPAEQVEKK